VVGRLVPYQNQADGSFDRQRSGLRRWLTTEGRSVPEGERRFPAEPQRYHLYLALICPWASRTLMIRQLKQLEDLVSVSIVSPVIGVQGWRLGGFPGATQDHLYGSEYLSEYLHQIYTRHDPQFTGRATIPVLWDRVTGQIVNNESADIVRLLISVLVPGGVSSSASV